MLKQTPNTISSIGIPKALLYHRYGILWEEFFKGIGIDVIVSEDTDKSIFDDGERASVDECCLASKAYMGHVKSLIGKCDAIFVPSYASVDVRAGFCTKYQSLPDLVISTFPRSLNVVSLVVDSPLDRKGARDAHIKMASELGVPVKTAKKAWRSALKAQEANDKAKAASQAKTFKLLEEYERVAAKDGTGKTSAPLAILLVAHPYIGHDAFIAGDIVSAIEDMDAVVIFADETDHSKAYDASFDFSETLPWIINRELAGSILINKDRIDGIVLLSAFPCGPDSMFDHAVMRSMRGIPILNLMIDAQSGSAGVQTRIESFIDILRYQGSGGYLNAR